MTIATFADWALWHATTFGLTAEADVAMLQSWEGPFAAAGYTLPELVDATNYMAAHAAPKFRQDHLRGIQERVNSRRVAIRTASVAQVDGDDFGCDFCGPFGAAGFVIVPHPKFVEAGEWLAPFATVAVTCLCPRGERQAAAAAKLGKPMLSLSRYEGHNVAWRDQVFRRDEFRKRMHLAETHAGGRDRALGSVADLARGIGTQVGRGRERT